MALTQNHAALNNLILAAAHAAQGQNAQAMTCLAAAATDPDLDEALSELNDELEEAGSDCEELSEDELEEAGEALAKVMAGALPKGHLEKITKQAASKPKNTSASKAAAKFMAKTSRAPTKAHPSRVKAGEEENMEPETASAAMSPSALIAAAHNRANRL